MIQKLVLDNTRCKNAPGLLPGMPRRQTYLRNRAAGESVFDKLRLDGKGCRV